MLCHVTTILSHYHYYPQSHEPHNYTIHLVLRKLLEAEGGAE